MPNFMKSFAAITGAALTVCLFFASCTKDAALPGNSGPIPNVDSKEWLLAHVDVETTGLLPGYHEMIDIGVVITDLDGQPMDSLFLRIQPEHPERLQQGAFECNAYNHEKWEQLNAVGPEIAVREIIDFHEINADGRQYMMVAHNCHFDSAFLDHLFRRTGHSRREIYHYYVLDIPSMAWGLGATVKQIMEKYGIEDEPHVAENHTGITGAMVNARVYRGILKYRKELNKNRK